MSWLWWHVGSYAGDVNNFSSSTTAAVVVTVGNVEGLLNILNMFLLDDD